jgi:hypothetical protein
MEVALSPRSNLGRVTEYQNEEDDDDYGIDEEMSHLSIDDNTARDDVTTGFKSAYYRSGQRGNGEGRPCRKACTTTTHGVTAMGLPYVLDTWHTVSTRSRISVQVQLLSGDTFHKKALVRVSTDKKYLVLVTPMSPFLARPDYAFNSYILEDPQAKLSPNLDVILGLHSKSIARKLSIAKLGERDGNKEVIYEQRIPLGRECRHQFAFDEDDPLFFGKKIVKYPDGSVHLHVELVVCENGDGYVANLEDPVVVKASVDHLPEQNDGVPTSINMGVGSGGGNMDVRDAKMDDADPSSQQNPGASQQRAIVLCDEYEGDMLRTGSVKRTARKQD